jgi:hypothetical protein
MATSALALSYHHVWLAWRKLSGIYQRHGIGTAKIMARWIIRKMKA